MIGKPATERDWGTTSKHGFSVKPPRIRTYLLRPNCSPQIWEDGGTTSFYITHLGTQGTELGPSIQGSQANSITKDVTKCADHPALSTCGAVWRLCSMISPTYVYGSPGQSPCHETQEQGPTGIFPPTAHALTHSQSTSCSSGSLTSRLCQQHKQN